MLFIRVFRAFCVVTAAVLVVGCGSRQTEPNAAPSEDLQALAQQYSRLLDEDRPPDKPNDAATAVNAVDCRVGDCRLVVSGLEAVGPKKLKGCGYDLKLVHQIGRASCRESV